MKKTFILIFLVWSTGIFCQGIIIKPNSFMTVESGAFIKMSGTAGLLIESDASGSGSFIDYNSSGGITFASGTATVQSYNSAGVWHNVSPTTTGVTVQNYHFDHNPDTWLVYHTESTNDWTFMPTLTDDVYIGQGYNFYIDGSTAKTVEYSGSLRASNLPQNLSYTTDKGFNFYGNPFPSALRYDGDEDWNLSSSVDNAVYVWDAINEVYLVYPPDGELGTLTDGVIPMGQGFFVHANSDSPEPQITIPVDDRIHSSEGFYKDETENKEGLIPHVQLSFTNNQRVDHIFIGFSENATRGFDNGYDAVKMYGSDESPQAYLTEQGMDLCIDVIAPADSNGTSVYMSYIPGADGEQIMNANIYNLPGVKVELQDLKTGIFQNLESCPIYSFSSSKNDDPDRFVVHFNRSPFGIDHNEAMMNDIKIFAVNSSVYIESIRDLPGALLASITDLYGKTIHKHIYINDNRIEIPVNVSSGMYVVNVMREGNIKTGKVFIK